MSTLALTTPAIPCWPSERQQGVLFINKPGRQGLIVRASSCFVNCKKYYVHYFAVSGLGFLLRFSVLKF